MPDPGFVQLADQILSNIRSDLDSKQLATVDSISFQILDAPSSYYLQATGTDPNSEILLGVYAPGPIPQIILFENSLERIAPGVFGVDNAIKDTLIHEIFQHGFGLDHTKETLMAGYLPSHRVPRPQPQGCRTCNQYA